MLETETGVCQAEHLAKASYVKNTTLQLSSFQMEGKALERWILLHQPKVWHRGEANAAGGSAF